MLASLQEDPYQVRIPAFEGPLDLLLQLIEREKLDISSISLAQVADQFLAYVRELEQIDAELLADFLVVASRLVWMSYTPGACGRPARKAAWLRVSLSAVVLKYISAAACTP